MDPLKNSAAETDVKLHFLDYWRIIRIRKTIILTVFLLVVFTTVFVTMFLQRQYCGNARIRIQEDRTGTVFTENQNGFIYNPYFMETEMKVMKSQAVLDKVIESQGLNAAWGQKYANGQTLTTAETRTILEKLLDLRPVRNTALIDIFFYSEDPNEAARIANEVANVYRDYRLKQQTDQIMSNITSMEKGYKDKGEEVRKAQEKVDQLRKNLAISDLDAMNSASTSTLDTETLRRLESQRIEAEILLGKERSLLNDLTNKTAIELRNVIPTAAPDPLLHSYLVDLGQAENKLKSLLKDFGPQSPEVQRVTATVDDLTQKVNDRINGILVGLRAKVDADQAALNILTAEVNKAKTSDTERGSKNRPYYDAKAKLEELQNFARIMKMKIETEYVSLNLPKSKLVEITDKCDPTTLKPVKPNRKLNIALGVIVGLMVGVGLAFFIEYLDTSVKTIDDIERALQSPVLGVIPQNVGRLMDEGAESPHAEAYRVLRTNLLFSRKDEKLNSVAVVSAGAGEGKSTTIFNLATVFAQSGQRVVIVDSDLRRPSLHKFFRVANNLGLTNYLLKQNTLEEVIQPSSIPTLDFMASGKLPSSSMGILSSAAMKNLITELKARYDFVFFDSPPIMGVSDASILASEVDMTIQVIQYRRYPQPMNIRAKQLIEKVGGHLMGIVLNNINMAQDESYYYYSGYYHEYYSKNEDEAEAGKPALPKSKASARRADAPKA